MLLDPSSEAAVFVIVDHTIVDLEFWTIARSMTIPEHLELHQIMPSSSQTRAVCLWQADSVDAVRDFIEPAVGHISRNGYFAVEAAHAVGLPTSAAAT